MNEADTFTFIEIVEGYENLWNISDHGYKDAVQRNVVWNEIGRQFRITGEKAKAHFKILREKYRRQKERQNRLNTSGAGSYVKDKWLFFNHLQFLDRAIKKRKVIDPLACSSENLVECHLGQHTDSSSSFSLHSQDTVGNKLFLSIQPTGISQPTASASASTPLPSPIHDSSIHSPSFCEPKPSTKTKKTVEDIFEDTSNKLMSYLQPAVSQSVVPTSAPKYNSAVVEFIVETLGKLEEDQVDACEKELMKVATKFRYNY